MEKNFSLKLLGHALQGVIFAGGKSTRMMELTSNMAKCCLPVGNKPLIWYPLNVLENLGVEEVIVIAKASQKSEVLKTLEELKPSLKYEVCISTSDEHSTADSLRTISAKINKDFIVLPCDIILNVDFHKVFDMYARNRPALVAIMSRTDIIDTPGMSVPGQNFKFDEDYNIVYLSDNNRLTFHSCISDQGQGGDAFNEDSQASRFIRLRMYFDVIDTHVYIMRKWVAKYLHHIPEISSIKGDLIPHLVALQKARPPPQKHEDDDDDDDEEEKPPSVFDYMDLQEELGFVNVNVTDQLRYRRGNYLGDIIRCYCYLMDEDMNQEFGVRVNSLANYMLITQKVTQLWQYMVKDKTLNRIDLKAIIESKEIDDKSVIAEYCKLREKASVKSSSLAYSTEVLSGAKVVNSIIMDQVLIEEDVSLENCVVSSQAILRKGCKLKNCLVGKRFVVQQGEQHENETLVLKLMEVNLV